HRLLPGAIEQDLPQPHGVHGQCAEVLLGVNDEAVLVLLGKLSGGPDDLVNEPGQIHRLEIEFELAFFDLREVQYLVDQAQEVRPPAAFTRCKGSCAFSVPKRAALLTNHLGQADDSVERGAQLMAHAGEELRLALARLRQSGHAEKLQGRQTFLCGGLDRRTTLSGQISPSYASTNRRGKCTTYRAVCGKRATLLDNADRASRKPRCGLELNKRLEC